METGVSAQSGRMIQAIHLRVVQGGSAAGDKDGASEDFGVETTAGLAATSAASAWKGFPHFRHVIVRPAKRPTCSAGKR
jgi:hypothetical protein